MLIDWVVGRDCRGDVDRQADEIGHARRDARHNIELLRTVSLDLADTSGLVGDCSRDTVLRMTQRFSAEVNQRVSDVFGRIIEQMKGKDSS